MPPGARRPAAGEIAVRPVLWDVGDGVPDRGEVLHVFIRDADLELLFGEGDDRHHRQRVDVEVVGEGLVEFDCVGGQSGFLVHDLGEAGEDVLFTECHVFFLFFVWLELSEAALP